MKHVGWEDRAVTRFGPDGVVETHDALAVEEPLEIRVDGDTVAITMRTPGDDDALALGFLKSEGIVAGIDDVGAVRPCGRPGDDGYGNVIDVISGPGTSLVIERIDAARRGTLTTSACGVCGRRTIDDLLARVTVVNDELRLGADEVSRLVARLAEGQPIFRRTGGLHAAAVFRGDELLASYEDVGRHNAVDKVVGRLLRDRVLPARGLVLAVSGRASFEIVHKAVTAGIAVVASVSAASTLAVDLAGRSGVTLAAFARDGRLSVYGGGTERIVAVADG